MAMDKRRITMPRIAKIEGLAGIDKAIKQIAGVGDNLNARIQAVAVAIVEHAAGAGNGDMSRALKLVKTTVRFRSINTAFLVGWFRHFASTTINLKANDGAGKVSLMARDAKGYRGFDVDGARANKWFEAVDANGDRAAWYAGPTPQAFEPETIGSIAMDMRRFVKRTTDKITGKVKVGDAEVDRVRLTEDQTQQVTAALAFLDRIANTLARGEEVAKLAAAQAELEAQNDDVVAEALEAVQQEKAVA
jgi:hypothetical protein